MSFISYCVESLSPETVALRYPRRLALGGLNGFFAKSVSRFITQDGTWVLSAKDLLKLARADADPSEAIFFDLTPRSSEQVNLYVLVEVKGRTASIITDALFHFKVACSGPKRKLQGSVPGELIVPKWHSNPDRYEQLRLEGGTRGGSWAWSEPPQSMSATIL